MKRIIPVKLYEEGLNFYEIKNAKCEIRDNTLHINGNLRFTPEGKGRFKGNEFFSDIENYEFHIRLYDADGRISDTTDLCAYGPIDNSDGVDLVDSCKLYDREFLDEIVCVEVVVDRVTCKDLDHTGWSFRRR